VGQISDRLGVLLNGADPLNDTAGESGGIVLKNVVETRSFARSSIKFACFDFHIVLSSAHGVAKRLGIGEKATTGVKKWKRFAFVPSLEGHFTDDLPSGVTWRLSGIKRSAGHHGDVGSEGSAVS
jgi:hypothetical protein